MRRNKQIQLLATLEYQVRSYTDNDFTAPQPQQKCFVIPTSTSASRRVASRGRRKQIPRSDGETEPAGHGADACWRAREGASTSNEHSPVPHFDASIAIQSHPTSELRGTPRRVRLPGRLGARPGAAGRGQIGRSIRRVSAGRVRTAARVGLHGGLDRVGRAAQASGEPSLCPAARANCRRHRPTTGCPERGRCSDAPCMHAARCNASASIP